MTPAGGPPGASRPRLVHVMTVPQTLELIGGQIDHVAENGFEVHAVASPGPLLDRFADRHRARVHGVPMERRISPLSDLRALAALTRLLRELRPTLVHSHTPKAGLLGMLAARRAGVPLRVYQVRGLLTHTAGGVRRLLLRRGERTSCAVARQVVCNGPSLLRELVDQGLCPAAKARVLCSGSNGVDARHRFDPARQAHAGEARRRLGLPAEAPVIGFVGRLVRDKGVAELTAAWRRLRAARPDLRLLIVGPFEERDAVGGERRELEADPRVHLTGLVDDMPAHYRAMDVLALPTYREGFPNAPLEAAAMGIPVVATRVVGCVDAVADGETGTLVPPRDAEALAAALAAYLDSPELRRRHGEAGRRRVLANYRPEPIWRATLDLYAEMMGRPSPWPPAAG